jgi:hypothetical protein
MASDSQLMAKLPGSSRLPSTAPNSPASRSPACAKLASWPASLPSSAERKAPAKSDGQGGMTASPCWPSPPKDLLPRIISTSSG